MYGAVRENAGHVTRPFERYEMGGMAPIFISSPSVVTGVVSEVASSICSLSTRWEYCTFCSVPPHSHICILEGRDIPIAIEGGVESTVRVRVTSFHEWQYPVLLCQGAVP